MADCTERKTLFTLVSNSRLSCSSVVFPRGVSSAMPAFKKRTSTRPCSFRMRSSTRTKPGASFASERIPVTFPRPKEFAVSSIVLGFLPVKYTVAPSSRNRWTVSLPMPLLPPVTRATLLFSRLFMVFGMFLVLVSLFWTTRRLKCLCFLLPRPLRCRTIHAHVGASHAFDLCDGVVTEMNGLIRFANGGLVGSAHETERFSFFEVDVGRMGKRVKVWGDQIGRASC